MNEAEHDLIRRKVVILGSRGVPDVQGGIETHVAALASRLVRRGWDVEVLGRARYLPAGGARVWNGATVTPLWAPRSRYFEALGHTALGLLVAARRRPDILHIHAIGPALLTPLARLLGLRVVVTHHGFDYERQKWGRLAKIVLRLGERLGVGTANACIAVSLPIAETLQRRWAGKINYIPNAVEICPPKEGTSKLGGFGLEPGRYVLIVARIVEEKRQLDLIAAFARLSDPSLKLAIVGGADHESHYLRQVETAAAESPGVVMTGLQSGEALAQLYAHAGLFVLPSSHEGMPIALLEALGYGLPVLASDIAANLALGLIPRDYVPLGDVEALAEAMRLKLAEPREREHARLRATRMNATHGWDVVADRTSEVYRGAMPAANMPAPVSGVAEPHGVSTAQHRGSVSHLTGSRLGTAEDARVQGERRTDEPDTVGECSNSVHWFS